VSPLDKGGGQSWLVVGCSVRGAGHELTGSVCQDANDWSEPSEELLVLAVADGAGSAKQSEQGAQVAVQTAVQTLKGSIDPKRLPDSNTDWLQLLRAAALSARDAVIARAAVLGVPERELASTLLLVVATPSSTAALQIGDGAIVEWNDGAVSALTRPEFGEHLN
jgi:serine/threonine protein phosphatase PrpC